MLSPNPTDIHPAMVGDTFELYDLKVEVVCPPNERVLCGAKDGDYFLLEGEMLKLPPGQGISIYSLSTGAKVSVISGLTASRFYHQAPCSRSLLQNRG